MRKGGRNMTKYCPTCGRALPDEARHCDFCGTRQPARNTDFSAGRHNYISTRTFGAAVDIAAVRNRDPYREWSYRAAPDFFTWNLKKVKRFAGKADWRWAEDTVKPVYYVSPRGAIGQVYEEDGIRYLEWCFYTREDGPQELPDSVPELERLMQDE